MRIREPKTTALIFASGKMVCSKRRFGFSNEQQSKLAAQKRKDYVKRGMADQGLEGSQPVDLSKHPSGVVPTLQ
ncbi:hypothetical protein RND71_005612 [Anisodus tanguticus]|uniref:Uncharacterized protein n=1 Tax=Anisodus tanguticus TaxID=243964 RepID=A0AAE1VVL9_9SOLA|nr:hypothetical protein RND71_005612 [Anisodus tanguticus]